MIQQEPKWLILAQKYIGLHEIKGSIHNKAIIGFWSKIFAPFRDDETPWCAAFVGAVLEECGIRSTRSAAARSYEKWGRKLNGPAVGAIVVLNRRPPNPAFGHVNILKGRDQFGKIVCVGGNQNDAVTQDSFDLSRVISYHYPIGAPIPETGWNCLPLIEKKITQTETKVT